MSSPRLSERIYSDPGVIRALVHRLRELCLDQPERSVMEVCGTHTMAIFRQGIRSLLPDNLRLISGPGCPVCVTPASYLDLALELARRPEVVLTTFGDLVRVPGSHSSLERERAAGADVRIVYSPLDAPELAARLAVESPGRRVVFLGVGFETTIPAVAQAVLLARDTHLENFHVLVAHRRVVPALRALLDFPELNLDGFLLPGHVSAVLGSEAYRFLEERGVSGVVAGFEPAEILRALVTLMECARAGRAAVENEYARVVAPRGNVRALAAIDQVFTAVDAEWRGLGVLPQSGLELRPEYSRFDAMNLFASGEAEAIRARAKDDEGCRCGEVLCGTVRPPECDLFGVVCTPETPVGPCMVSSEGTCAAYYKYGAH